MCHTAGERRLIVSRTETHWLEVTAESLDVASAYDFVVVPGSGAVSLFVGTVRNHVDGRSVRHLEYAGYPEMAESILSDIAGKAFEQWALGRLVVRHRLGILQPGEASVIISLSSPHRREAFEACRFVIEQIKKDLPVWKKEHFADGGVLWQNDT